MSWPAVLLWVIMIGATFSRGPLLLYLVFASGAFGSLQMLPGSEGGLTLLPQTACSFLLVCKVLVQRGNLIRGIEAALDIQRLVLFTSFLIYSITATVLLPWLFSGIFEVVPVSALRFGTDLVRPATGNITQSVYMLISYSVTLSFAIIGQSREMRRHFLKAILIAAFVWIAAGFVDLIVFSLHIDFVLDPFRTANYSLLTDNSIDNVKRVVGLMPEASAFGAGTVGILALLVFLRPHYQRGWENIVNIAATGLLLLMSILSTSSTAYFGLVATGLIYLCNLTVRLYKPLGHRRGEPYAEVAAIAFLLFAMLAAFLARPTIFDPAVTMIDKVLFQKAGSSSFEERSLWTQIGWQAFLDSGGLGAGLGSIRVSNWVVSIIGSTGLLGGLLMFGFIFQQLMAVPRDASEMVKMFATGVKLGLLPTLLMYQVAATIPDLGIAPAAMLGLIAASHRMPRARSATASKPHETSWEERPTVLADTGARLS